MDSLSRGGGSGGRGASGDGWSAAVDSSRSGANVPMNIHGMVAPVVSQPGASASFGNPMMGTMPMMNVNPLMGIYQSVPPCMGPLPSFPSFPSYGIGQMNPAMPFGLGTTMSTAVPQALVMSPASAAGPWRAAVAAPSRGTQSANDQESAIRGFLREAGVDEQVLSGSYFDMVEAMRGLRRNHGGA